MESAEETQRHVKRFQRFGNFQRFRNTRTEEDWLICGDLYKFSCSTNKIMDVGESPLPEGIHPNNFPAKLWRLVNNPAYKSICWDKSGEVVVIDQQLFEKQILTPSSSSPDNANAFKTTNFSSFVRQLNLYGFKKTERAIDYSLHPSADGRNYHHFYNPDFKLHHPELIGNLMRLTADNKAKLQAGLTVTCRPPSRYQRQVGAGDCRDMGVKGGISLLTPPHQRLVHPYLPHKAQAVAEDNRTPVPPRYLIRDHDAARFPPVSVTDKGTVVSLSHHNDDVASSSSAMHTQQGLLARPNHGNSAVPRFNSCNALYPLGCFSPVFQCYYPNLVTSHMAGSGLQTGQFSPHSFIRAGYPVNLLNLFGNQSPNSQNKEKQKQEVKKCEINLDTIFHIADEEMQTPPNYCAVKVDISEEPGPELELSSSNMSDTTLSDKPEKAGLIIIDVTDSTDLVTYRQLERSVVSVPEQMPEDAIYEGASDSEDAKDAEVVDVTVNATHLDPRQADSSGCKSPSDD